MNKCKILVVAILLGLSLSVNAAQKSSVLGKWTTIDDNTNKARSVVELYLDKKGKLNGKIINIYFQKGEGPNDRCKNCEGDAKGKKILGLKFIWNLTKDDNEWAGGTILDPSNGKTYRAELNLIDGGKKLHVRGYIGMPLFGRTQIWQRFVDKKEVVAAPAQDSAEKELTAETKATQDAANKAVAEAALVKSEMKSAK